MSDEKGRYRRSRVSEGVEKTAFCPPLPFMATVSSSINWTILAIISEDGGRTYLCSMFIPAVIESRSTFQPERHLTSNTLDFSE